MRLGLRGRGECRSECPLRALVSIEEDSAIMKRSTGACCVMSGGAALWGGRGQPRVRICDLTGLLGHRQTWRVFRGTARQTGRETAWRMF
jgi:hypothetical protein